MFMDSQAFYSQDNFITSYSDPINVSDKFNINNRLLNHSKYPEIHSFLCCLNSSATALLVFTPVSVFSMVSQLLSPHFHFVQLLILFQILCLLSALRNSVACDL